jgi:hypothetical protein
MPTRRLRRACPSIGRPSASHASHPPQRRRESRLVECRSDAQAQRHWSASCHQALKLRSQYPSVIVVPRTWAQPISRRCPSGAAAVAWQSMTSTSSCESDSETVHITLHATRTETCQVKSCFSLRFFSVSSGLAAIPSHQRWICWTVIRWLSDPCPEPRARFPAPPRRPTHSAGEPRPLKRRLRIPTRRLRRPNGGFRTDR